MCLICSTIPTTAALGIALDARSRSIARQQGRPLPRQRPFLWMAVVSIPLFIAVSIALHSTYPGFD